MRFHFLVTRRLILILLAGTALAFSQSNGPVLRLGTNSLNFEVHRHANTPSPLTVTVSNAGGGELRWTAVATATNGLTWLSVTPASGTASGTLTVTVDHAELQTGSYTGSIQVSASDAANSPQTIAVTLVVTDQDQAIMGLSSASLRFGAPKGGTPSPQTLQLQNLGGGTLGWTAAVTNAGDWLAVSPSTGVAPSAVTVTVSTTDLAAGTYTGAVTFSALPGVDITNSPQIVMVSLGIDTPMIFDKGVVNGASFSPDAVVSPGSLATIFGSNLARQTASATSTPWPTTLADVHVEVSGVTAPLYFVSPEQINFQVPTNIILDSMVLRVSSGSLRGTDYFSRVLAEAPGIFISGPAGATQGVVANQDSSINSAENPAVAGSVVQIYATGLGATDPPMLSGYPGAASEPFNRTVSTPEVLIGGVPADVEFSAVAPGFVGLYQVNARIPAKTVPGAAVPVQIQMGGSTSNTVTIAVKPAP